MSSGQRPTSTYTGTCQDPGCKWGTQSATLWQDRVHQAVYHSPGWQQWQEFRKSLVGLTPPQKLAKLKLWPLDSVANKIRIVNYLRAIRGSWAEYPSIATYARYVAKQLEGGDVPRDVSPGDDEE